MAERGIISRTFRAAFPPITPVAKAISSVMKRDASRAMSVFKSAFERQPPHPEVAAETDPDRRFRVAMEMAGRVETDLPDIERTTGRRLELYCILTMIAALWMFIAPALGLGGISGFTLIDVLFPLGFTAFLASKAFAMNVALYRIQRRSMVPIREFLRDRKAWLGGKPSLGTTKFLSSIAIGIGLSALLPFPALANGVAATAAGGIQSVGSGLAALTSFAGAEDLSLEWLRRLFPGMANIACAPGSYVGVSVASCTASDADVLGAMMGTMNSILLGLGSFMMAFHTIVATVSTAHEGKVMGERWHTVWAPIRVVIGFGLLVPIKGYCGIQFAVLMVIVMGYNMANAMWTSYVDKALSGEMASLAVTMTPSLGLDLAHSIIASETCVSLIEAQELGIRAARNAGGGRTLTPRSALTMNPSIARPPAQGVPAQGTDGQNGSVVWNYGDVCGSIRTAADNPPLNTNSGVATAIGTGNAVRGGLADMAVTAGNQAYVTFLRTRDREISALIEAVRTTGIAASVVSMTHPGNNANAGSETESPDQQIRQKYGEIRQAAATFETNINTAAREMVSVINAQGTDTFKQRAAALGWASAGALNTTLLRASARASELTSAAAPRVSGPNLEAFTRLGVGRIPEVQQRMEAAMNVLRGIIQDLDQRGTASPRSTSIGADMQGRNLLAQLIKPITDGISRGVIDGLGRMDPVRPMSSIQNLGNNMLLVSQTAIGVWIAAKGAGGAAGGSAITNTFGGGFLPGALEGIAPFFVMSIIPMLICGALHAYILPMLPFIMWTFAILAVVSLAAELVIAAPLAAFMHLRMDGNELINEPQKTIYTMTFNALLRPSLLLCGLVVANLTFAIMANYLNKVFGVAVTNTNGDSIVGLVGVITMTILIFYLHYQLVVRSMQLISAVPATVSELIGARDQDRDAHGEGMRIFAAVGNITTRGANAAGAALNKPVADKPNQTQAGDDSQSKGASSRGVRPATGGQGGRTASTEGGG